MVSTSALTVHLHTHQAALLDGCPLAGTWELRVAAKLPGLCPFQPGSMQGAGMGHG